MSHQTQSYGSSYQQKTGRGGRRGDYYQKDDYYYENRGYKTDAYSTDQGRGYYARDDYYQYPANDSRPQNPRYADQPRREQPKEEVYYSEERDVEAEESEGEKLSEEQERFVQSKWTECKKLYPVLKRDDMVQICMDFEFEEEKIDEYLKVFETEEKYKGISAYEWQETKTKEQKGQERRRKGLEAERKRRQEKRRIEQEERIQKRNEERKIEMEQREQKRKEYEEKRLIREEQKQHREMQKQKINSQDVNQFTIKKGEKTLVFKKKGEENEGTEEVVQAAEDQTPTSEVVVDEPKEKGRTNLKYQPKKGGQMVWKAKKKDAGDENAEPNIGTAERQSEEQRSEPTEGKASAQTHHSVEVSHSLQEEQPASKNIKPKGSSKKQSANQSHPKKEQEEDEDEELLRKAANASKEQDYDSYTASAKKQRPEENKSPEKSPVKVLQNQQQHQQETSGKASTLQQKGNTTTTTQQASTTQPQKPQYSQQQQYQQPSSTQSISNKPSQQQPTTTHSTTSQPHIINPQNQEQQQPLQQPIYQQTQPQTFYPTMGTATQSTIPQWSPEYMQMMMQQMFVQQQQLIQYQQILMQQQQQNQPKLSSQLGGQIQPQIMGGGFPYGQSGSMPYMGPQFGYGMQGSLGGTNSQQMSMPGMQYPTSSPQYSSTVSQGSISQPENISSAPSKVEQSKSDQSKDNGSSRQKK